MKYSHVSPEVILLKEDNKQINFKKYLYEEEKKPTPDDCKDKIKGIMLTYAFCGEQDFGIKPLEKAFGVDKKGIIKKAPIELIEKDGVRAIKFGRYIHLNELMIKGAKNSGLIGYWDEENIIICAAPEYGFIIDSIKELIKPNRAWLGLEDLLFGNNLMIVEI